MGNVSGFSKLIGKLEKLLDEGTERVAIAALGAGVGAARKTEQKASPNDFKAAIGSRITKASDGVYEAKVGLAVGRAARYLAKSRKGHFYVLGTDQRYRKKIGGTYGGRIKNPTQNQLSTGYSPAHPFIRSAWLAAKRSLTKRMQGAVTSAIRKELK